MRRSQAENLRHYCAGDLKPTYTQCVPVDVRCYNIVSKTASVTPLHSFPPHQCWLALFAELHGWLSDLPQTSQLLGHYWLRVGLCSIRTTVACTTCCRTTSGNKSVCSFSERLNWKLEWKTVHQREGLKWQYRKSIPTSVRWGVRKPETEEFQLFVIACGVTLLTGNCELSFSPILTLQKGHCVFRVCVSYSLF